MDIIVKTFQGLEEILEKEIQQLGASQTQIIKRGVKVQGDLELLYRLNYHLRTAIRVLVPLFNFKATTEDDFYRLAKKVDWSQIFSENESFAIDPVVRSEYFKHSKYISLKCKDAIVDFFKEKTGNRPNVDPKSPDIRLNLYINQDYCEVLLDSSGDSLHKRGYRRGRHEAPINEVLASGLVQLSDWTPEKPLLDPMCGSGTILIEAAMIACNMPAQFKRDNFCFKNWRNFDRELWSKTKMDGIKGIKKANTQFQGQDISLQNIKMAQDHARYMGLDDNITFKRADFLRTKAPFSEGVIISNPPYGERIGHEIEVLYNQIGTALKHEFTNYSAWFISSNLEAFKQVGLRTSRKIPLFNGPLECRFVNYQLYQGSKRQK